MFYLQKNVSAMKKTKTPVIYLVLGSLFICGLNSCGLKKEKITPAPPVRVEVMAVRSSDVSDTRTYSGTVESGNGSELSFSVAGTIKNIYVAPGKTVTKGQLLAELNDESLVNAANIAQATLEEVRDAYARLQKLHDADALPDIKWTEMQSKLKQAENAADIANRAVKDARIYAPVSGVIAEKNADAGQTVIPAMPVLKIVALGDVKVSISVPENEISAMKPGRNASISIDALGGESRDGVLTEQGVVANPLSRTYDVKFRVDNADGELLPGMLCSVKLTPVADSAINSRGAIVLPPQAVLLSADNRNFVWLANSGKARMRYIKQGGITADGIIVSSGINPGDSVITAGMQKISNGTEIVISEK